MNEFGEHPELLGEVFNQQLRYKGLLINTSSKIKNRILQSGDRKLIDLYDEVQALKQAIGKVSGVKNNQAQIDSLKSILTEKDKNLTQLSSYYISENKKPTWQEVQAKLGKKEAVIEIIRYQDYNFQLQKFTDRVKYAALIITPKTKNHPELVMLSDGNFLEEKAVKSYKSNIEYQFDDEGSYQYFWMPFKEKLKSIEKVYFSPDGVFFQVNMATLFNTKKEKYLFEEINVMMLTSSRDLLKEKKPSLPNKYAILMGNPDFGVSLSSVTKIRGEDSEINELINKGKQRAGLLPLPGTEKEVKIIRDLLKEHNWRERTLLKDKAQEHALKNMLKPKVLHIATHGFFQENAKNNITYSNNPMYRSGILLSGAAKTLDAGQSLHSNVDLGNEDGVLTAFEAMNLNIDNTDLVVLSACETGLGEIKNGEGVFGLQRAFTVAGARSVLMSLWKVDDNSTQELMVSFYKHWLGGKTKREALKEAQMELKKKYEHPYYWGAFVLIGE